MVSDHLTPLSPAWRYALVGGVVALVLIVVFQWLPGPRTELSLNAVFVGGLLAGYLARTRAPSVDATAVGVRTGLIGSLAGLLLLVEIVTTGATLSSPLWFRVAGTGLLAGTMLGFTVVVAVLAGLLGAHVGGWLGGKTGKRSRPAA